MNVYIKLYRNHKSHTLAYQMQQMYLFKLFLGLQLFRRSLTLVKCLELWFGCSPFGPGAEDLGICVTALAIAALPLK